MKKIAIFNLCMLVIAPVLLSVSGCAIPPTAGERGAIGGAAAGALVGQAIGRNTKSTLIGAGAGALGGAVLNNERARRYNGY